MREAIWAVVVFAGLCAALMAVSAYLDPFDLRLSPWRADVDRRTYISRNMLLWAAGELQQLPPEAFARARYVIVGDSRCRQLSTSGAPSEADRFIEIAGAPVLNLAFGGAFIGDSVDMFAGFADSLTSLRAVVLCTPLDKFSLFRRVRQVDEALAQVAQPWRYLLNLDTIITFFWPAERNIGALTHRAATNSARWRQTVGLYLQRVKRLHRAHLEKQLRESFDRLRAATGPDVQLIFYMPPMAGELEGAYAQRSDLYRQVLERLGKRGTVFDYALYDGVGSAFEFADPAHVLNGSRPILEDMLATFEGRREVSRFAVGGASPLFVSGRQAGPGQSTR